MSMMDDNDSLFREPLISNVDIQQVTTRTSLGHTATLVSLGESRVSFGDLRQHSVPTMLGAGESGFPIEEEEEEGAENFDETTPTPPGEQDGEEMLHESQSTLKYSHYSFRYAII